MSRQISDNAKKAVFAQSTDEAFITLAKINHPSFVDGPVYVCDDAMEALPTLGGRGVISRGQEYVYMPFSMSMPMQDDTGLAQAKITIENVSRQIIDVARRADSSLSIHIEVVMASDVDSPEITMPEFKIERIKYDAMSVSGDLSVEYYDLEPFPARRFSPADFAGLF